jgi:hypothetical protein
MSINEGFNISMQFLVQRLIWLDPNSYQILQIKTGMLLPGDKLKEQITDIYYQETRFKGIQHPFWLPKEVNVSWILPNRSYINQHKHSDFRLFLVETDYKLNRPQTKNSGR